MKIILSVLAIFLVSCSSTPKVAPIVLEGGDVSGLQHVTSSKFDRFVIQEGADFSQYDKVIFFPMTFDRLKLIRSKEFDVDRSWSEMNWKEIDAIAGYFDELAKNQFKRKELFQLTNTGGNDVLAIEFRMKQFRPLAHREGAMSDKTAGEFGVSSFGSLTIEAVLANAKTGELVAVIEDGMDLADGMQRNIKPNQAMVWRKTFRKWLERLNSDLVALHEYSASKG